MANKKKDDKPKMGRPTKDLTDKDVKQIGILSAAMNSWSEIAAVIGWNESTLKKKEKAKHAYLTGMEKGRSSLKAAQFRIALGGNPTMLIWLGKIHLGQKEIRDVVIETDGPAHVTIGNFVGATDG